MNQSIIAHEVDGLKGRVLVDGFRHQSSAIEAYFLTHFHGDHYGGLSESFDGPGLIHCTTITARLVVQQLGVKPELVKSYDFEETATVCGASVTFLDANHCPGAALLLFELPCGTLHLHTGDMRYSPRMKQYPSLQAARGRIDRLYLDTTYCHPKHTFQPQEDSVSFIADSVAAAVKGDSSDISGAVDSQSKHSAEDDARFESTIGQFDGAFRWPCLVLLSAYKIGKERVMLEVARRSGCQVYVDDAKLQTLQCLGLSPDELALFTTDMAASPIHVCRMGFAGELWPFFRPNFTNLQRYVAERRLELKCCHAFIPTGWADSSKYNKRNALQRKGMYAVQCVPYSEHSNFSELLEFVAFLKPKRVVPTVFSDDKDYRAIEARFARKVDANANKRAFVSIISRGASTASTAAGPRRDVCPCPGADTKSETTQCSLETNQQVLVVGDEEQDAVHRGGGENLSCDDVASARRNGPPKSAGEHGIAAGSSGDDEVIENAEVAAWGEASGGCRTKRSVCGDASDVEVVDLCSDEDESVSGANQNHGRAKKRRVNTTTDRSGAQTSAGNNVTRRRARQQTTLQSFFSPSAKCKMEAGTKQQRAGNNL